MSAVQSTIEQLVAYQAAFEPQEITAWMAARTPFLPVAAVVAYLVFIFGVPLVLSKPLQMKNTVTVWNFILATFSIAGAVVTVPHFVSEVSTRGVYGTLCAPGSEWYTSSTAGFWSVAFALSKIPEMIDTVLLVLQKKPVIFLHWYHHVTVMLYCWFCYLDNTGAAFWYCVMNYVVHAIMYSYYFMMSLSATTRKMVKPIAPVITTLQLLQMVAGMVISVFVAVWSRTTEQGCAMQDYLVVSALVMYGSYFVLFAALFKKLYFTKKTKKVQA